MFIFLTMLNGVNAFGLRTDYSINTEFKPDTTPLDVFMVLFMVCTIEIVVLKIMVDDDGTLPDEIPSSITQN